MENALVTRIVIIHQVTLTESEDVFFTEGEQCNGWL